MKRTLLIFGLMLSLMSSACSMRSMALKQTIDIIKDSMPAFEREEDFELAKVGLPANLKTLEGFLVSSPKSESLLIMLARGYSAYGLVIIEDEMEELKLAAEAADEEESPAADHQNARAKFMYFRAHKYAATVMEEKHPGFNDAFKKGGKAFEDIIKACDKEDVPALFWSAMPLASAINIGRDDVGIIAFIPRVKTIMERIVELDESYYFGGAHLILGGLYGGVGKMLGGDAVKAKKHFEKALELTKRRFLLVQIMYARMYAVQNQDKKLFDQLLKEILDAKLDILPEQKLANTAAKRMARRTLKQKDELF